MENKIQFRYFVVKMLFQALYLEIKPLKSLAALGENPKSQLLKNPSIEFFETQDLIM